MKQMFDWNTPKIKKIHKTNQSKIIEKYYTDIVAVKMPDLRPESEELITFVG